MMIRNFAPGFHEAGKIKIGCAGEAKTAKSGRVYHLPRKLDHFIVTTVERDPDPKANDNFRRDPIMAKLGEKPREIAIRLIFDSIEENFDNSYSFYLGNKCLCRGNGETATRRESEKDARGAIRLTGAEEAVKCPCDQLDPSEDGSGQRCKPYGILMCVLEKSEKVGGVYKFRTTSYNSIRSILTSLTFIRQAAGGILAGLPLWLTVQPKQVTTPQGQKSLVHVVNIEFRGSLDELIAKGADIARIRAQSQLSMKEIRKSLKLISMRDAPEDEAAVSEEFHPEGQDVTVIIDGEPVKRVEVTATAPASTDPPAGNAEGAADDELNLGDDALAEADAAEARAAQAPPAAPPARRPGPAPLMGAPARPGPAAPRSAPVRAARPARRAASSF